MFCWYRRRKQDQDDFDDQFTLSGPKADMTQTTGGGGIPILDSNPFLLAGGYNNFDTSQQQTPRQPSGRGSDALAVGAGAGSLSGYHKYNSSSGTSGDGNHSFGSQLHNNQDEFAFYDANTNGNDPMSPNYLNVDSPNPEYGRRKLSNGSLPDMIARNPGSLKVVNN